MLKVSTPNPMPERLLLEFAKGLDEVMAVEELDPVLEQEMLLLSGRHHLPLEVKGKLTGEVQPAGENSWSLSEGPGGVFGRILYPVSERTGGRCSGSGSIAAGSIAAGNIPAGSAAASPPAGPLRRMSPSGVLLRGKEGHGEAE